MLREVLQAEKNVTRWNLDLYKVMQSIKGNHVGKSKRVCLISHFIESQTFYMCLIADNLSLQKVVEAKRGTSIPLFWSLELSKKRFWTLLDTYKKCRKSLFQNDQQKTRNIPEIRDYMSKKVTHIIIIA